MTDLGVIQAGSDLWIHTRESHNAAVATMKQDFGELRDRGIFKRLRAVVRENAANLTENECATLLAELRAPVKSCPNPKAVYAAMKDPDHETVRDFLDVDPVRGEVWKLRRTRCRLVGEARFYNGIKARAGDDIYQAFDVPLDIEVDDVAGKHRGWLARIGGWLARLGRWLDEHR